MLPIDPVDSLFERMIFGCSGLEDPETLEGWRSLLQLSRSVISIASRGWLLSFVGDSSVVAFVASRWEEAATVMASARGKGMEDAGDGTRGAAVGPCRFSRVSKGPQRDDEGYSQWTCYGAPGES